MSIKLGIAPDSWGVWFPDHEKQPSWDRCLNEMQEAGFAGVETGPWGYFPNDPETLKKELGKRNLDLVATTAGTDFLDDEAVDSVLDSIDDMMALMKHFPTAKYVVLLPAMYTDLQTGEQVMDPNLTDEQWAKYVKNVQRAADHVTEGGYIATFHPHVDCHVETEEEIERLLNDTNENVQLCLDTGHHVYGGGEPISFYKKHADRIPYIHIKDCDLDVKKEMDKNGWSFAKAVTEDIMVEPGKGTIDFKEFRKALDEKNYSGWCVCEQDFFPIKNFDIALPIAKRTYETLKNAGF